jgi:hypothetical protein
MGLFCLMGMVDLKLVLCCHFFVFVDVCGHINCVEQLILHLI